MIIEEASKQIDEVIFDTEMSDQEKDRVLDELCSEAFEIILQACGTGMVSRYRQAVRARVIARWET